MARSRNLRRGIYLLPTIFTVGNLFCGYSCIVLSSSGAIAQAALMVILAGVLDGLDGRLARLTGTTSDFGVQFDSLADIVSFGVAPAVLAYHWALEPLGRMGWTVAFLFVVCAAMRLARFNIQTGREDKRFFAGLPSPAAAGVLACFAFAFPTQTEPGRAQLVLAALLVVAAALLMVSMLRYRSFKDFDLRNRRSYIYILPLAAMLIAIVVEPRVSLLSFAVLYVLSAPLVFVTGWVSRQFRGDREAEVVDGSARG